MNTIRWTSLHKPVAPVKHQILTTEKVIFPLPFQPQLFPGSMHEKGEMQA